MKCLTTYVLCSLSIALAFIARSEGQQPAPGAGPPSPQIALPAEQQAAQGPTSGLSGPGAVPNPRAGAVNQLTDQNAVPSRNATPAPSPGVLQSGSRQVQSLYEKSVADGSRGAAITTEAAEAAAPTGLPTGNSAQQRGRMGVWLVDSEGPGVRIGRITDGSAADRAGLRNGDVILQVNGRGATSAESVARFIRTIPIGQTATVTLWRDGQQRELQVAIEPVRESFEAGYRGNGSATSGDLNARVTRLEQQLAAVSEELQQLRQMLRSETGTAATGSSPAQTQPNTSSAAPNTGNSDQSTPSATGTEPQANPGKADDLFGPDSSTTN